MSYYTGQQFGEFTREADGRYSGHVLTIKCIRRDGRFSVGHKFGSGAYTGQILTREQLDKAIQQIRMERIIKRME